MESYSDSILEGDIIVKADTTVEEAIIVEETIQEATVGVVEQFASLPLSFLPTFINFHWEGLKGIVFICF